MSTKIAVLGKGKTGAKVIELMAQSELGPIFDTKNPPTLAALKGCDALIAFVPAQVLGPYLDLIFESGVTLISGATGFEFPQSFDARLKEKKRRWVSSSNFSLGMNVIKSCVKIFSQAQNILDHVDFTIHEVHHTKKLDAPSGTALLWQEWLGKKVPITSAREGDVVGLHQLKLTTSSEEMTLIHEAKDRQIFAQGAIWAAKNLNTDATLPYGLIDFSELVEKKLKGSL